MKERAQNNMMFQNNQISQKPKNQKNLSPHLIHLSFNHLKAH